MNLQQTLTDIYNIPIQLKKALTKEEQFEQNSGNCQDWSIIRNLLIGLLAFLTILNIVLAMVFFVRTPKCKKDIAINRIYPIEEIDFDSNEEEFLQRLQRPYIPPELSPPNFDYVDSSPSGSELGRSDTSVGASSSDSELGVKESQGSISSGLIANEEILKTKKPSNAPPRYPTDLSPPMLPFTNDLKPITNPYGPSQSQYGSVSLISPPPYQLGPTNYDNVLKNETTYFQRPSNIETTQFRRP